MVEVLSAACMGVAMATACGLRVFLPLLALSVATHFGLVQPAHGLEWVGSWSAMGGFALAAAVEVVAYYVPWLDHALDTIATPLSAGAGTLAAATQLLPLSGLGTAGALATSGLISPETGHAAGAWLASLAMGVGVAGVVQLFTVGARAASTATTGGIGNWLIATAENIGAAILSVLAILAPIGAGLLILGVAYLIGRRVLRRRARTARPTLVTVRSVRPRVAAA